MKFIYTGGELQYFDGMEFFRGVPVDVQNQATIDRLKRKDDFMEVVETPPSDPKGCPKCGKVIGRGRVMHEKHCKG